MFLFSSSIVKRLVLHERSTQSEPDAEAPKRWLAGLRFKGVPRIQRAVLCKDECVAVNGVCARTRDDVNRPPRSAARFCGESVIDNLKFLNDFWRKLSAARTRVLIVVIEAIDRNVIAA